MGLREFIRKNKEGMILGGILGLIAGLIALGFGYNPAFTIQGYGAIDTALQNLSTIALSNVKFIVFITLLGILIGGIMDVILPEGWFRKWMKK